MGRRQFLTVRKRRCNERDTLKSKKQDKNKSFARARVVKHVYGTSVAPICIFLPIPIFCSFQSLIYRYTTDIFTPGRRSTKFVHEMHLHN